MRLRPSKLPSRRSQLGYFIIDPYRSDQYAGYVVFLCHFDGADGSNSATNEAYARRGRGNVIGGGTNRQIDTAQALFGTASAWINNATTTYWLSSIGAGVVPDYAMGTGDFTIEFAVRTPSRAADIIYDQRPGVDGAYPAFSTDASGNLFYYVSSAIRITGSGVIATNTWQRIAVSRNSGVTRMFVEGVQVGSSWTDSSNYLQGSIMLGSSGLSAGGSAYNGWIDEVRVTKGIGRYPKNYTVSPVPFPNP